MASTGITDHHAEPTGLPDNHRYITTHDATGKAIYSSDVPDTLSFWKIYGRDGHSARFELGYTTEGIPVQMNGDRDLSSFKEMYANKQSSGLVKHGGALMRFCDIPPGAEGPMHRTSSLDYGIIVSGSLECVLDSGESRIIHAGDVMVQRGTNHLWKNNTDKWARIIFILFDAVPLEVNGTALKEDIGGLQLPQSH